MPRRKELDDYAETAVLPPGSVPLAVPPPRAMTAQAVVHLLDTDRRSASASVEAHHRAGEEDVAEGQARYEEYLRMLDEVPVLSDIVDEPPRVRVPDFRRGERPDVRREPREDPYTARERREWDIAQRYVEYVETLASGGDDAKIRLERQAPRKRANKRPKRTKRTKRRKK